MKPAAALLLMLAALPAVAAAAAAAADYAERYARVCAACHGAAGDSVLSEAPSLGGQPSFYAITQLFLYRAERRTHPAMVAVAKALTDDDLRGFSDFIGTLPPPPPPAAAPDPARFARGRATAERSHCLACHGSGGEGGKQVARIANQREDYLQRALAGFKAGNRVGYTQAMNEAIAPVKVDEIDDLAHFLAHLK